MTRQLKTVERQSGGPDSAARHAAARHAARRRRRRRRPGRVIRPGGGAEAGAAAGGAEVGLRLGRRVRGGARRGVVARERGRVGGGWSEQRLVARLVVGDGERGEHLRVVAQKGAQPLARRQQPREHRLAHVGSDLRVLRLELRELLRSESAPQRLQLGGGARALPVAVARERLLERAQGLDELLVLHNPPVGVASLARRRLLLRAGGGARRLRRRLGCERRVARGSLRHVALAREADEIAVRLVRAARRLEELRLLCRRPLVLAKPLRGEAEEGALTDERALQRADRLARRRHVGRDPAARLHLSPVRGEVDRVRLQRPLRVRLLPPPAPSRALVVAVCRRGVRRPVRRAACLVRLRLGDLELGAGLRRLCVRDCLDAAARRGEVLCDGQLERAASRQRLDHLHEPLAEGSVADDDPAVRVLHDASHDLGGRGGVAVDEDDEARRGWQQRRLDGSVLERGALAVHAPLGRDDVGPLRDEELRDADRRVEQPARVVAQVEHERLERLARGSLRSVQPHHRPRELLGGALGEAVQLDVPGARRHHCREGDVGQADLRPLHVDRDRLLRRPVPLE
mmetsp:Transcript_38471/g.124736  ORF Transcript_38471/g.124736 Transcript_38471/m.124736 type:complete len:573 (+) Transcript_38471:369-2087(+)